MGVSFDAGFVATKAHDHYFDHSQSQIAVVTARTENALKYRGSQPSPRIDIGIIQQDEGAVFFVRDNGMGIDPAQTKRIFQLFSQLNHGSDGVGLGLALVKKIVNGYDGRIWAESGGLGQGSTFFFTLPKAVNDVH